MKINCIFKKLFCILLPLLFIHQILFAQINNLVPNASSAFDSSNSANKKLSNLSSPTAVNITLQPGADSSIDLGSPSFSWRDLHLDGAVYLHGIRFLASNVGTGAGNTALGTATLANNTTGYFNTASGYEALYSNTSGIKNTASGYFALYSNTTGKKNSAAGYKALYSNTTGNHNTANGYRALNYNSTGSDNTATGYRALNSNTTGEGNTASGYLVLFKNITGNANTASGYRSLYKNTTGERNTTSGFRALTSNVSGNDNTAIGYNALDTNTTGIRNTGTGAAALSFNSTGSSNTATGFSALSSNTTGSFNTALGEAANVSSGDLTNATALGYSAIATASNSVMLGNTSVTSVKAAGSIVIVSDGRFKKNIKTNVPGLDFINALKPVTYNYDINKLNAYIQPGKNNDAESIVNSDAKNKIDAAVAEKEKIVYSGFVAQDVEKAANKLGYDFSGIYKPQNNKDPYGLSYSEFVVPLVKAVQELSKMNSDKDNKIDDQQKQIDELRSMMLQMQQCSPCSNAASQTYNTTITGGASLEQNAPNPFNHTTTINYNLSQQFSSAQIIITDKSGKILKEVNLSNSSHTGGSWEGAGKGSLNVDASTLASGAYSYSLYIDGRLIDSKQMILAK